MLLTSIYERIKKFIPEKIFLTEITYVYTYKKNSVYTPLFLFIR